MRGKNFIIGLLVFHAIIFSILFEKLRPVIFQSITLLTILAIPLFFIILLLSFFGGFRLFALPGVKPIFVLLIVLILLGGIGVPVGNEVHNQLTSSATKATDVFFTKEALNLSMLLIIGAFLFTYLLLKKG
ncbi:hypothetical protein GOV08_02000 [Candidatus Woesearchaeota archaeon]|nr:hypothetical protein [Candidatus Woesearchaeota archaeon]